MKRTNMQTRTLRAMVAGTLIAAGALAGAPASAGGLLLYEIGTEDVGLASAGYTARAQDASTVFTNPAGMTRLDGSQLTAGLQALYGDLGFTIGQGTSPALGSGDGGNPVGWFPGGGAFYSYSVSPDLKLGFAATGNFGLALKYDGGWAGRYYVQEGTLVGMSLVPSVGYRVNKEWSVGASVNAMYAKLHDQVAVNNIVGADGRLEATDYQWGFGGTLGVLYEPSTDTRFGLVWNSPIKLDFSAPPQFSGLSHALDTVIRNRGLDANLNLGMTVPQGVNASFFHQLDARWALLGSRRLAAMVEVRRSGDRHRLVQPDRTDQEPELQRHLARRGGCAVSTRFALAARFRRRLRLGVPGQLERLAATTCELDVALWVRRAEAGEQDVQLGAHRRVRLRR